MTIVVPPLTMLADLARAALEAVVNNWPDELQELPARQFVTTGGVAWDAELLAVSVERTFGVEADVTQEQFVVGPMFFMRGATIAVTLTRAIHDVDSLGPEILLPDDEDITSDAVITLSDAQAILNAFIIAHAQNELGTCNGIAFESWTAQTLEGGLGGGVLRARFLLI